MANAHAERVLKAKVDLVGNPIRTEELRVASWITVASATPMGTRCAQWHQVLAVVTANPVLALKPVVEDLTVRAALVAALAQGDRWEAVEMADGKPLLEALLEALAVRQPCRERQMAAAVRAIEVADAATKACRLAAYYAAATAFIYAS